MLQVINELKEIPGVAGVCIYNLQLGLRENNLSGVFQTEKLAAIGKQLTKLYTAGQMSFEDMSDLTLNYDESIIVTRMLQNNHLVFAICDPSTNQNLLRLSLNLLQKELHNDLMAVKEGNSTTNPREVSSVAAKPVDADLTVLFEKLREHLAKIMGPMAGFIFDEVFNEWQMHDAESQIENLLGLLYREISDQDKIKHYQTLIDPALKHFRTGE